MRVLVGLAIVVTSAVAAADPAGMAWQAPHSCPDDTAVRARIEAHLGRSLDDVLVAGIAVVVSQAHGTFVARIATPADTRTLTSRHCDELADAVAVVIARVARDRAAAAPPAAEPPAAPPRVAIIERDDAPVLHRAEVAHPDPLVDPLAHTWSIGVRVSGVSGIGIIPEVGLGAELALTLRRHSAMAEISATKWLATDADVHVGTGHVDVGLGVTAVRFGWRPERTPLRGWVSAEVGQMTGDGVGVTTQQTSGRWFAAGAGFGVAWQMTRWARLVGSTEVLGAFERVRFALGDGVVVYAPSPVSARASCGLEVGWQ
jgi:hypothetical protein